MERHREAVRLIPDALDRGAAPGCSVASAIGSTLIAREEQLFLLRDPDRDERFARPELLQSLVGRRELPLAAVDQR